MTDLSILIVNWNSKEDLSACLRSLFAMNPAFSPEVIVVDNASYDGVEQLLQADYPAVRFIQSDRNLGFAKANNMAAKESRGDILLFLNPDTEFVDDSLVRAVATMQDDPSISIAGFKILNTDRTLQTSCLQSFPSITNQFLDSEFLRKLFPKSRLWGVEALLSDSRALSDVDVVSGACLMIRRNAFESVGGFSEEYFMYSEDVDLCYKVRSCQGRNVFMPFCTVVHHGGSSSSKSEVSAFSAVMMLESRWKYFLKTRSRMYGVAYRAAMFIGAAIRLCACLPTIIRHRADHLGNSEPVNRHRSRARWALGLETWASRYPG
jgi:GT2 family glycosyltransferase